MLKSERKAVTSKVDDGQCLQ